MINTSEQLFGDGMAKVLSVQQQCIEMQELRSPDIDSNFIGLKNLLNKRPVNRRRFISLLGQAVAGATVAYSFPSIIVPRNIQPVLDSYLGLAYIIRQGRYFRGLNMSTFPDMTPEMFNSARKALDSAIWRTNENLMIYPAL